jgi:hypothetical protein
MAEGTLEIIWQNPLEQATTRKYQLFFLRYRNFKSGAQRPNVVVGSDGLESYLLDVGFKPELAKSYVAQVHTKRNISINYVEMPEQFLAAYAN